MVSQKGNIVKKYDNFSEFLIRMKIGNRRGREMVQNPNILYFDHYWMYESNYNEMKDHNDTNHINEENVEIDTQNEKNDETYENKDEDGNLDDILFKPDVTIKTNAKLGDKIQRYDLDGKLLRTYNSISDIFKHEKIIKMKLSSTFLKEQLKYEDDISDKKENFSKGLLMYQYVWLRLPRSSADNTIQSIHDPMIKKESLEEKKKVKDKAYEQKKKEKKQKKKQRVKLFHHKQQTKINFQKD